MEQMLFKKRIEWVDIARGILIFLVCLGHRHLSAGLLTWVYTFHLPAFFLLSGYLAKNEGIAFSAFLKKKAKGLLIPYVSLGVIYIVGKFVYSFLLHKPFSITQYLWDFIAGRKIGSSWFIVALFLVEFAAFFLQKLNIKLRLPIVACIATGGFVLNYYIEDPLFWNVQAVPIGLLFFECGILVKAGDIIHKIIHNKRLLIVSLSICLIGNALATVFNERIDMNMTIYGNVGLFLLGALCGTGLVFLFSIFLEKKTKYIKKPPLFYGKNTLPIIEFHFFPVYELLEIGFYKVFGLAYNSNRFSGNIESIVYAILCFIIFIPIILFFNRCLPWCVGKKWKPRDKRKVKSD